jgi:hypothetical protein
MALRACLVLSASRSLLIDCARCSSIVHLSSSPTTKLLIQQAVVCEKRITTLPHAREATRARKHTQAPAHTPTSALAPFLSVSICHFHRERCV